WTGLMQPFGKMPATHLRHDYVGEKQIDLASATLGDQTLSVIAIGRFNDLIAKFAQYAHRDVPDTDVVFENENCFGAARQLFGVWFLVGRPRRCSSRQK